MQYMYQFLLIWYQSNYYKKMKFILYIYAYITSKMKYMNQITSKLLLSNWNNYEITMSSVNDWDNMYAILNDYNLNELNQNKLFIRFCKYMLKYHPNTVESVVNAYLYQEIPKEIIMQLNITPQNKFDILVLTNTKKCIPVQCIFKNDNGMINNNNICDMVYKTNGILITNGKIDNLKTNGKSLGGITMIDNKFFLENLNNPMFEMMKGNVVEMMDVE